MSPNEFRKELVNIMPNYAWTVHRTVSDAYLKATGTQSSEFNRISTLRVVRIEKDTYVRYEVKSAGYGLNAPWLHGNEDKTLARALRGLQSHYEAMAATYRSHAERMNFGRTLAHADISKATS